MENLMLGSLRTVRDIGTMKLSSISYCVNELFSKILVYSYQSWFMYLLIMIIGFNIIFKYFRKGVSL